MSYKIPTLLSVCIACSLPYSKVMAIDNCTLDGGCDPSQFTEKREISDENYKNRLTTSDSNKDLLFNINKRTNVAIITNEMNRTLTHNNTLFLQGIKGVNQSFAFSPTVQRPAASNVKFDLNKVIISESAFYQTSTKDGVSSVINVKDMWVVNDSGIVSYYSKQDNSYGANMTIDNVHITANSIFNITMQANQYAKTASDADKLNINIGKIETGENTILNFMGVHSRGAEPMPIDIHMYDGDVYSSIFEKTKLDLNKSTLYLGSDMGIDENTQKWLDGDFYGYKYTGDLLADMFITKRFTVDKDFDWNNKDIDAGSKIYFYNSDFVEAKVLGDDGSGNTTVNASDIVLVKNRFYGNNTFNATNYDIYDAQFYRNDTNSNSLVAANDEQHFTSQKKAKINLHYSASLNDYSQNNFVGLRFDNADVNIKGDNGVFKLEVKDVDFSLKQDVFTKDVEDILDTSATATSYENKTAIISADNVSIDPNTKLEINDRDFNSTDSVEKNYTKDNSTNITYSVKDSFSIAANGSGQSLYYVTNALNFTMNNDATLNLDTDGNTKYFNHILSTRGDGQKTINILNSQESRGSVEFTNKNTTNADFSVASNATLKLGLNNAIGDSDYSVKLEDSSDELHASILDLNGFDLNVSNVSIDLGNNSIISAGTSSTNNSLTLTGVGEPSVVLNLDKGKTATILADTNIDSATVRLGYDNQVGKSTLIIGNGIDATKFSISGSYNDTANPIDQAHLHIGDANILVKDNSTFGFGPNAAIHIGTDKFDEDDYNYDIDNENKHTGGGLIQLEEKGNVEITLNSSQGSHIYVNSLIGINSLKYLFSGDGSAIDENNKVIDRITFIIDGQRYADISKLTPEEVDELEAKIDTIINQQLGDHVKLQDISIEIREDGIFLAAENIENAIKIIYPNLDNGSVIEEVLKLKTDDTNGLATEDVENVKNTQAYDYISKLIDNTVSPENQTQYGSDVIVETVSESVDHIAQLATVNRLQYMSNLALDNTTSTVMNRGYNRLLWDKQVDLGSNLWADAFTMNAKINKGKTYNHNLRSEIDLYGVLVGYDHYVNDHLLLGAAIGYNTGKSNNIQNTVLSPELNGEIDNYLAVIYGSYRPYEHLLIQADAIYMMGNATASLHDNKFAMQDFDADVDINAYSFDAKLYAPFKVYDNLILAPFVGGSISLITTDEYEVRTNNSFYSKNKSEDINIYYVDVGVSLQGSFNMTENVTVYPSLDLSYINYYGDTNFETTIDYQNNILGTDINKGFLKDDSAYNARMAFKFVYDNMDFDLYAGYLESDSYENITLGARFNIAF